MINNAFVNFSTDNSNSNNYNSGSSSSSESFPNVVRTGYQVYYVSEKYTLGTPEQIEVEEFHEEEH